jgi:hypothetical protein
MGRYSVYDYTRRVYDYYDGPGPGGTHAGSPPRPREVLGDDGRPQGAPPTRAAWKLPLGAKKVGSGELPQGRIASLDGADLFSDPSSLLLYGAIALVAWKVLR